MSTKNTAQSENTDKHDKRKRLLTVQGFIRQHYGNKYNIFPVDLYAVLLNFYYPFRMCDLQFYISEK